MAKVKIDVDVKEIRRALVGVVCRVSPRGEIVISRRPDMSHVEWSEAQKAHRLRFKEAVAGAKAALAEPGLRALYEARAARARKRAWDIAVADHFAAHNSLPDGEE